MKYLMRKMILSATRSVSQSRRLFYRRVWYWGLCFFAFFFFSATFQLLRVFCDFSLKASQKFKLKEHQLLPMLGMGKKVTLVVPVIFSSAK